MDIYGMDNEQEELKYPEYLKAYIDRHKLSEFMRINPMLKDHDDSSKELILKINIESTSRLARIEDIKSAIAEILGLKSAALRLVDIKEGCVVATFLIPTSLAEVVFNEHTILTKQQEERLRSLPILHLECNGRLFNLTSRDPEIGNYYQESGLTDVSSEVTLERYVHACMH